MKTKETPYREQLRLRREITFRSARILALEDEARSERIHLGFKKVGKMGCKVEIDSVNHICVSGEFRHPVQSWSLGECFGLEGNHGIINSELDSLSVTIQADDNKLLFTISWPISDKPGSLREAQEPAKMAANVQRVKQFFKRYRLPVDCTSIKNKRDAKLKEAEEMNTLIGVITTTTEKR